MSQLDEIRDLLKRFSAGETIVFPAEVLSVDTANYTAIVKPGEDPEMKVRLKAAINDKKAGFLLMPSLNSTVLIALILNDPNSGYICAVDEIEQVEIRSENIKLNDGNNGGLIVHEQLLNEYNKTKAVVDEVVNLLKTWTPIPQDGGAALKTAAGLALAGKSTGDLSEITNDKVKH